MPGSEQNVKCVVCLFEVSPWAPPSCLLPPAPCHRIRSISLKSNAAEDNDSRHQDSEFWISHSRQSVSCQVGSVGSVGSVGLSVLFPFANKTYAYPSSFFMPSWHHSPFALSAPLVCIHFVSAYFLYLFQWLKGPARIPLLHPTIDPAIHPTIHPTIQPSIQPSTHPSVHSFIWSSLSSGLIFIYF